MQHAAAGAGSVRSPSLRWTAPTLARTDLILSSQNCSKTYLAATTGINVNYLPKPNWGQFVKVRWLG